MTKDAEKPGVRGRHWCSCHWPIFPETQVRCPLQAPGCYKDREPRGRSNTALLRHQRCTCIGSGRQASLAARGRNTAQAMECGEQRQTGISRRYAAPICARAEEKGSQDELGIAEQSITKYSVRYLSYRGGTWRSAADTLCPRPDPHCRGTVLMCSGSVGARCHWKSSDFFIRFIIMTSPSNGRGRRPRPAAPGPA